MRNAKWRVLLSVSSFALAVVLGFMAAREYHLVQRLDPLRFYEGNYLYMPPAQAISYCLNSPAYVASNLVRNFEHLYEAVYWFPHDGGPEYYIAVFIFWWCIGWKLDDRSNRGGPYAWNMIRNLLGVAFSCLIIWEGVSNALATLHRVESSPVVFGAAVVWGLVLLGYFGSSLLNAIRHTNPATVRSVPWCKLRHHSLPRRTWSAARQSASV